MYSKEKRRQLILERLAEVEKIDIEKLAEELDVSTMTIRRDLSYLEEQEEVIRTHGGAVLNKPLINESPFQLKEGKHSQQKKHIAQKAIQLIPDQATILLDSGTTTLEIARLMKNRSDVTIVTNDIKIAAELMDSEVKVIITGGELQNRIGALFGNVTENILREIHVDLFFLGAHAIDINAGITAPGFEKASIKKLMIEAADQVWLVSDSSKFKQKSFTKVCSLSELDGIITDQTIDKEYESLLKEHLNVMKANGGNDHESWSHSR
ncbi:DeoR/GlpR family DNA-binding transcription regulator [Salinibacillus aidingensis]|uniref:DeoR/GlpR family DNA-binding transcription regulator n=1 Tax=Salinibacillus aidingensis TaxID=237684 RepID=A0ABN1AX35_9BACI